MGKLGHYIKLMRTDIFTTLRLFKKHRLQEDHESTILSAEVMFHISFVSQPLKMDYAIAILKNKLNN